MHYGEEVKEVSIRKDKKLGELCSVVLETFEVKDLSVHNMRVRTYDDKLKVKLTPIEGAETSLHKLNVHSHMHLIVESKVEGETFEAFNSDTLYLRVVKYVEGDVYDFRNLEKLPS